MQGEEGEGVEGAGPRVGEGKEDGEDEESLEEGERLGR